MSLRRVGVLLGKELRLGLRNVFFIFAVVMPVVITILVSLLFGTIFSGKARVGFVDQGASQVVARAAALTSLDVRTYASPEALRTAAAQGMVDLGMVLPAGFDERIARGETTAVTAYLWGESTLRNRTAAATAFANVSRQVARQEAPVEIVTTTLGDGAIVPWETRLLPFIVLMAVIFGGTLVPAALLVEEKQRRTLRALTTTSASLGEVFASKGLLGILLSVVMSVVTLWLNRAWGGQPALLLLTLTLGAVMAAAIGLLLGAFLRDMTGLMTAAKAGGILLYAPALVYLFPELPQWIGRLFPTYYLIGPVMEIIQEGGTWASVAPELAVLAALDVALLALAALVVRRAPQAEGALNPA
ncbi:MAG: ABC transporter permease [Chloroflexi bacterium]|nr:ABC transporter permease [Chloroflexota bacterium]